jgi:hypothetical protein
MTAFKRSGRSPPSLAMLGSHNHCGPEDRFPFLGIVRSELRVQSRHPVQSCSSCLGCCVDREGHTVSWADPHRFRCWLEVHER